jgi:hypothetical protein
MRDTLEKQILADAYFGDTTVFAELLGLLTDKQVFNALSDENQKQFKKPEEPVIPKGLVRITYRMETYIPADTEDEAKEKFENIPLNEIESDFVEVVSVEVQS